ncbi:RTA1 like protein-domain-containing protein [Microdochium bolleyi]|uniref:RTA1 like protein-domain-containing protein n=1 Tax=Microdochium bolleyi TaxID=196109 RepID=A0A136JD87_9PEZI|nr:RTA1 like protein-domain-containing protein [Microdochium bolleyi]
MANLENCDYGRCSQFSLAYPPSLSANAALCACVGALVVLAVVRAARNSGLVFAASLITGLSLEVLGYVGRILLGASTYNQAYFAIFFQGTVLAPNFICCAVFLCLPNIVYLYGPNFRTWTPPWYHGVVLGLAVVSFFLELIGGVLATTLVDNGKTTLGFQLVAIGLAVLIAVLAIFVAHATLLALALRTRQHSLGFEHASLYNSKKFKLFLFSLGMATVLLSLRSTFRLITVISGFTSQDSHNEVLFLVLDGVPVMLAAMLLLVLYPPRVLKQTWFSFRAPKDHPLFTTTTRIASSPARSPHYGIGYSYGLPAHPSQPGYSPYSKSRELRLPGPPPHPPPPRPAPPPAPLRPMPRTVTTQSQRSPGAYSDHRSIGERNTANIGGQVNYSRKHSMSSAGGEPSPSPHAVMPVPAPPVGGEGRAQNGRNMVESESLW